MYSNNNVRRETMYLYWCYQWKCSPLDPEKARLNQISF